jgi:hypothetical protein
MASNRLLGHHLAQRPAGSPVDGQLRLQLDHPALGGTKLRALGRRQPGLETALEMARWRRRPAPGAIVHSDSQYLVSFRSTLQRELLDRRTWTSRAELGSPSFEGSRRTTSTAGAPASAIGRHPSSKPSTPLPSLRHDHHTTVSGNRLRLPSHSIPVPTPESTKTHRPMSAHTSADKRHTASGEGLLATWGQM